MFQRVQAPFGARLLHVDEDIELTRQLGDYLGANGYAVDSVGTLAAGRQRLRTRQYDALLTESRLPDGKGCSLAGELRSPLRSRRLPLLMLSAQADAADRIVGLESGADDFLAKPCHPRELLARVNALLRRAQLDDPAERRMRFGRLEIDLNEQRVRVDGFACALTAREFALLALLARHAGRAQTREQIMTALTGHAWRGEDRSIDVHVSRLRRAIEVDPVRPRHILTVRGVGYALSRANLC